MNEGQRGSGGCYPVWFRQDLPRDYVQSYWRDTHAGICAALDIFTEYRQHHFAREGHGFWPAPEGVGAAIPRDWHMDGLTENRFDHAPSDPANFPARLATLTHDEQNIFDRVTPKRTSSSGNIWWTGGHDAAVGFRAVILLRARAEQRGAPFTLFLEGLLAPALLAAGATELHSHNFDLEAKDGFETPNVAHDEPPHRAYDAALIIGTADRDTLLTLLDSDPVAETAGQQKVHCVALHAYAVEATYPIVVRGERIS